MNWKNITTYQKVSGLIIFILLIMVVIFIFQKVNQPPKSEKEIELEQQVKATKDSLVLIRRTDRIEDSLSQQFTDSIITINKRIAYELQKNKRDRQEFVNELRDADADELQRLLDGRYPPAP